MKSKKVQNLYNFGNAKYTSKNINDYDHFHSKICKVSKLVKIPQEIKSNDYGKTFYQYYCDYADEEEKKNIHDWENIFERIKGDGTKWCASLYQFHEKFKTLKKDIGEQIQDIFAII